MCFNELQSWASSRNRRIRESPLSKDTAGNMQTFVRPSPGPQWPVTADAHCSEFAKVGNGCHNPAQVHQQPQFRK